MTGMLTYGNNFGSEEDSEEDKVNELKTSLSKINKKTSVKEFNHIWELVRVCKCELSYSLDLEVAFLILKAIQKLINFGLRFYYPGTLCYLLNFPRYLKNVNKGKTKEFNKLLKSLFIQVKVMAFASKNFSLNDLKTLSTPSTNIISSPAILSKEPESIFKKQNERTGLLVRSGRPSVKLNRPRVVDDEASKEFEEKEILIKSINPSILATILDKRIKCKIFGYLKIPIPVIWLPDDCLSSEDEECDLVEP
jgi:hypothetical protein